MKKFFLSMSAMILSFFVLFGCSNDVDNSSLILAQLIKGNTYSGPVANLSVSAEVLDSASRAIYVSDIQSAKAIVEGFDYTGKAFSKESPLVSVSSGKGSGITVSSIPVCKNAVVTVKAYANAKGTVNLDGIVITQRVDINQGENNSATVSWNTSKEGNVYAALIKAGVNTNTLTDTQKSSIAGAIPTDIHAALIDAGSIASDYKSNSLKSSSSYKLTAGTVKVTCNDYDGCTLQVNDPVSSNGTAVKGSVVTISNVAPGTWTLYVLDGTTVKTSKSVVVTGGETATVTIGQAVITDKIIVHAKGYKGIYIYDTTGITTNSYDMTSEGNDWYTYTLNVTSAKLIFKTTKDSWDGQTGNLTRTAGEWWFIGDSGSKPTGTWYDHNPEVPVAPTVTISPVDGSQIAVNGSISVQFTNGNDTITSAKVTVNGKEYNMGTTAGTWTKSLSELGITSEGVTVTVSASVTNSVGTGTDSVTLTTTKASQLVTNPNELRIYQVMVSSFQDGDPNIGYSTAYGPRGQLTGGDLQGIINAVDYIKSLGCNALWMTPIFQSAGNEQLDSTGYFCSDYFNIDYHFGTNEKFAELVEVYHNAGINVILDGVFGHHGGSVANSPSGYNVSGKNPVNYTNTNTQNFYKEVAEYWIKNYRIDGWRLDQCYQVGLGKKGNGDECNTGGHNYWYDIRKVVENAAAGNGTKGENWGTLGYMVGEHWDGQSEIQKGSVNPGSAGGYGLKSCFDFPSRYNIVNAIAKAESDAGGNSMGSSLSDVYKDYHGKGYTHPEGYYPNLFITNHDLVRLGNLINWKHGETPNSSNYWKRHKLSLAIMAAYTGPITIYYGDEWGAYVDGYTGPGALDAYNDNASRSTGKISGFNSNESDLLSYAKKLMAMRSEHEALWNGTSSDISTNGNLYVGKKVGGGETIIFAINNSSSSATFSATGKDLITGESVSGSASVDGYSARFILVK